MKLHRGVALPIALLFATAAAQAGMLDGNGSAVPGFTGTVAYDNGNNLSGTIDYAVFTAADFTTNFGGNGYTPTDAYVYTYQVINAGSDNFSQLTVGINGNLGVDAGAFTIGVGEIAPSNSLFDGSGNAEFQFSGNPVTTGASSYGLAFSAPTGPELLGGIINDGGGALEVVGLPTPSPIPEPASACLIAVVSTLALARRRRC